MYFATKREAAQMLWMLQNKEIADRMVSTEPMDATKPFADRFELLRRHALCDMRKEGLAAAKGR